MVSTAEQVAFLTAHRNTDRSACRRWIKDKGTNLKDAAAVAAAEEIWHNLPLLFDPALAELAARTITTAKGPPVSPFTRFCATVWRGKFGIDGGLTCDSTINEFVIWLRELALTIAPKGEGWVACPTSNRDGKRTNASTTAMWALNFDSDGRGTWGKLLDALTRLGVGCVAYQSGGWSPAKPKWHILILLSQPFDVSSPEKIEQWKMAYNCARVCFGALGGLLGEGFDPTVETPSVPVFLTERRKTEDPPREVVFLPGAALDIWKLMAHLPSTELREFESGYLQPVGSGFETTERSAPEIERIVDGLCEPMSKILSSRRDLYMALPGALLDRGVEQDDVIEIIEAISDRCPGDPSYTARDVAEKHREHVHCARTTVSRWDRGDAVTRIGTLMEGWPDVAYAIDDLLPDPALEAIRVITERWRKSREGELALSTGTVSSAPIAIDLHSLRKRLAELRNRRRKSPDVHRRIRGLMLESLLDGEDFVPYIEPGRPANGPDGEPLDRDRSIGIVGGTIAYRLPVGTPFEAVAEIARPSLHAMLRPGETLDGLLRQMERAFLRSLGQRLEDEQKKEAAENRDRLERASQGSGK